MTADFDKLWDDDRVELNTLKEFCRYWYECGQKSKVETDNTVAFVNKATADIMEHLADTHELDEESVRKYITNALPFGATNTRSHAIALSLEDAESVLRSFKELNPVTWPVVLQRLQEKSQQQAGA